MIDNATPDLKYHKSYLKSSKIKIHSINQIREDEHHRPGRKIYYHVDKILALSRPFTISGKIITLLVSFVIQINPYLIQRNLTPGRALPGYRDMREGSDHLFDCS